MEVLCNMRTGSRHRVTRQFPSRAAATSARGLRGDPVDTHSHRDTNVNRTNTSRRATCQLAAAALLVAAGCAASTTSSQTRSPAPSQSAASSSQSGTTQPAQATWPVRTREHVDLWLHAYALLTPDSNFVPYFRRGYRDQIVAVRRQRGISTLLDTSRPKLLERINLNPALATGPQFLPFYFASWDQFRDVAELFVQRNGNPRGADQTTQQYFAILSASFQTAADREWLRQFVRAVEDESTAVLSRLLAERVARACGGGGPGRLDVAADVAAVVPALPEQHAAAERRAVSLAAARRRGSHGALQQGAECRRGPDAGLAAERGGGAVRLRSRDRRIGGEYRDRGQHDAGRTSRGHVVAIRGSRRRCAPVRCCSRRSCRLRCPGTCGSISSPPAAPRRPTPRQRSYRPLPCPTRSTMRSHGSST